MAAKATGLEAPWTRAEIGAKIDVYNRSGTLKLDVASLVFMPDLVCLTHAFCWAATTSVGTSPAAIRCR